MHFDKDNDTPVEEARLATHLPMLKLYQTCMNKDFIASAQHTTAVVFMFLTARVVIDEDL